MLAKRVRRVAQSLLCAGACLLRLPEVRLSKLWLHRGQCLVCETKLRSEGFRTQPKKSFQLLEEAQCCQAMSIRWHEMQQEFLRPRIEMCLQGFAM